MVSEFIVSKLKIAPNITFPAGYDKNGNLIIEHDEINTSIEIDIIGVWHEDILTCIYGFYNSAEIPLTLKQKQDARDTLILLKGT